MFLRQAMFRLFGVAWTSPAMIAEKLGTAGAPLLRSELHGPGFMGRRNKQHERHGGTAAPVFSLHHLASKNPRLLIGGGRRRRRRHITEPGWRRRSGLRWRRASRSRLLGARVLSPVKSVEQPESPETGECRG